jgi:hypothetical protein
MVPCQSALGAYSERVPPDRGAEPATVKASHEIDDVLLAAGELARRGVGKPVAHEVVPAVVQVGLPYAERSQLRKETQDSRHREVAAEAPALPIRLVGRPRRHSRDREASQAQQLPELGQRVVGVAAMEKHRAGHGLVRLARGEPFLLAEPRFRCLLQGNLDPAVRAYLDRERQPLRHRLQVGDRDAHRGTPDVHQRHAAPDAFGPFHVVLAHEVPLAKTGGEADQLVVASPSIGGALVGREGVGRRWSNEIAIRLERTSSPPSTVAAAGLAVAAAPAPNPRVSGASHRRTPRVRDPGFKESRSSFPRPGCRSSGSH